MLTYKEFYIWLDGYLTPKLENKHIDIAPIVEKMGQVKDDPKISIDKQINIPIPVTPFPRREDDTLGKPPKIVM